MGLTASYCSNQRLRDSTLEGLMYVLSPPLTLFSSDLVSFSRFLLISFIYTHSRCNLIQHRGLDPSCLANDPIHMSAAWTSLLHPILLDFYSWMSLGHVKHTLSKAEPPISLLSANHLTPSSILSILVTVSFQVALFESRGQKNRSFQIHRVDNMKSRSRTINRFRSQSKSVPHLDLEP